MSNTTASKILKYLFVGGVAVLPFIFWSKAAIPYEIPRVWFFRFWVEILGLATLISITFLPARKKDYLLYLIILLFFLVIFLASYWGVDFNKSFWGNPYREDGLITFIHLCALFFVTSIIWQDSWKKSLMKWIFYSNSILSLWVVLDAFRFFFLKDPTVVTWQGALGISFGNPNFLAGYFAVTFPFQLSAYLSNRSSLFKLGLVLPIIAILLTRSWAGVLSLIIFFIVWILALQKKKTKKIWILCSLLVTSLLLVTTAYLLNYFKTLNEYRGYMPEGRVRIFTKAILAFRQRPLLGWGLSNFDYAFNQIDWPMKWGHDLYVDKTHSMILEVLVSSGAFGLTLYLLLTLRVIQILTKPKHWKHYRYFFFVFLVFLIHSQTNVISISEEIFFWIIGGVSTSLPTDSN